MEKQYEELCVAFQQIILHFGRMAFQQPGYVTAVLHETAPQTDVLAEALQQLDTSGYTLTPGSMGSTMLHSSRM